MPEQNSSIPTGGTRYVEVSPPTGWKTMAETVYEIDEDKVEGCKDDIDTLLVFAGLYSAVLSAFLVVSYTYLLPDSSTQMIFLLERIAVQTQSYTITSGTLNSTAQPPPSPPQFMAPLWAVRLNGLWFASLIISLATASFSMLVKQWLREYLAVEYTAPQERLRAHQYRKPALEKWKVFEVAGILPMLLQLSLGLFFIGLCLFTANVDERIGHTTIPLVCGWAFFLIATTLAPLASPRCPYKMPLLKSMMRMMRTHVTMKTRRSLTSFLFNLASMVEHSERKPAASMDFAEEKQVVNSNQDDKDILLSMDTIMADDNLLTTMWGAFKQRSHEPAESLAFIVELVLNRVGTRAEYLRPARLRCIPDLTSLSRPVWNTFMEMLADLADRCEPHGPLRISSPDWLCKASLLLLSSSPHPLPSSALACLRRLLAHTSEAADTSAGSIARWIAPASGEEQFLFRPLSHRLCQLYKKHSQDGVCLLAAYPVYAEALRPYCKKPFRGQMQPLFAILSKEPHLFTHEAARAVIEDLWNYVHFVLLSEGKFGPTLSPFMHIWEVFFMALGLANQLGRRADAGTVVATLWANGTWANGTYCHHPLVYTSAAFHHYTYTLPSILQLAVDAFTTSLDQAKMIQNSTGFAEAFAQGSYTQMEVVDIVHFCLLHIQLYAEYVTQSLRPTTRQYSLDDGTRVNAPDSAMWANLWKATGIALRAYLNMERQHAIHGRWHYHRPILLTPVELLAKDQQLAGDCLEIMGSIERGGNKALQSLSVGEPVFPDDLIAILGHFILAENIPRYPRLARLLQEQESRWSALAASVSDLANEAPPTHATEFRPDPLHHQSRRGSFRSDSQEGRPASPFVVPPAMSEGSGWAETTQEDGRGDVQDGHGGVGLVSVRHHTDSDDTTASTEGHLHEPGGGIGDGDTHIHEGDADVEDSTSLIGGGGVEGHGRSVSGHEQPDQGRPEGDNEGGERSGE